MKLYSCLLVALVPALSVSLLGQEPNPMQNIQQQPAQTRNGNPIFRVQVVSRSIAAVTYRDRSGWTKVDLQGTSLAPKAKGNAQVRSQPGYMQVKVDVKGLPAARTFGKLY